MKCENCGESVNPSVDWHKQGPDGSTRFYCGSCVFAETGQKYLKLTNSNLISAVVRVKSTIEALQEILGELELSAQEISSVTPVLEVRSGRLSEDVVEKLKASFSPTRCSILKK